MPIDSPIFFDPTGKRWRRAKLYALLAGIVILFSSALLFYKTSRKVNIPRSSNNISSEKYPVDNRTPADIAYRLQGEMPIIGDGVFLRVVGIYTNNGQKVAADIFSGDATRKLNEEDLEVIGDKSYAIERYGPVKGKYIVLTFDDGPDPNYTPQILDVLSKESAASTFFPIGANVVKYPEIAKRIASEGHDIANHTFTHADLDHLSSFRAEQEINQTQRVIRSVTGMNNSLFRIPYGGFDDESVQDDRRAILEAQRLGYTVATDNIDSHDWEFAPDSKPELPEFFEDVNVVLLHDGGGNRTKSVEYMTALIKKAKSEGYQFTSLSRLLAEANLNQPANATIGDRTSHVIATASIVWPKKIIHGVFIATLFLLFVSVIIAIVLAELQMLLMKPARRRNHYNPLVSVIVPAYNEAKVLQNTIQHILRSNYRNLEVIIVDDGSKDDTWKIIKNLRRRKKVIGLKQANSGKAAAINRGLNVSKGEIIVCVDADTIFMPKTIGKMVRYFYYQDIGAVAGVVKVGNIRNWITRWQALEYVTSINIERTAQAFLRAITVVPGACSAWRKEAIQKVGGFSGATMAEDCDLTLAIQKAGYNVTQDMEAVSYTESPEAIRMLAKQRFRWMFGNLQAYWKHRDMIFRKRFGWLGMYTIPKAILGIMMQLIFAPILLFVTISSMMSGELEMVLLYALAAYAILFFTAAVALAFAREKFRYLTATPAFRLVYSPLRTMLLYASVLAALGGLEMGWNKVTRSGSVDITSQKFL